MLTVYEPTAREVRVRAYERGIDLATGLRKFVRIFPVSCKLHFSADEYRMTWVGVENTKVRSMCEEKAEPVMGLFGDHLNWRLPSPYEEPLELPKDELELPDQLIMCDGKDFEIAPGVVQSRKVFITERADDDSDEGSSAEVFRSRIVSLTDSSESQFVTLLPGLPLASIPALPQKTFASGFDVDGMSHKALKCSEEAQKILSKLRTIGLELYRMKGDDIEDDQDQWDRYPLPSYHQVDSPESGTKTNCLLQDYSYLCAKFL